MRPGKLHQKHINFLINLTVFIDDPLCHERPPAWRDQIIQWSFYTGFTVYVYMRVSPKQILKRGIFMILLTHWGRLTHICISKVTIIGPDNGLSPGRRQAIIWTNDGMLLISPLGKNLSEILMEIHIFSFKKMPLKMSSAKCRPFCLGLNLLIHCGQVASLHGNTAGSTLAQVMICCL